MRSYYYTKTEIEKLKSIGLTDDQIGDLWKPSRRLYFAFSRDWIETFQNIIQALNGAPK